MFLCKYYIIEKRSLQKNVITRLSPKRVLPEKGLLFYVMHNGSFPVQWCASVRKSSWTKIPPQRSKSWSQAPCFFFSACPFRVGTCYRENCTMVKCYLQNCAIGNQYQTYFTIRNCYLGNHTIGSLQNNKLLSSKLHQRTPISFKL